MQAAQAHPPPSTTSAEIPSQIMSREIVQKDNIPVKIDGIAGSASFTHTATEGQGMANSSGYEYEVFLSFRGEDTRTILPTSFTLV
ncbi:hypothetical protein EUGRSUZ_H03706 [Eucalyptus grandis]|uniref:Uncharacterized protein n=2 Tax=Eucalyptus grandis TaxID=71139 RepID=A0ACC3JUP1_EUCGR|nr:hypothetical protein EUGRSUZ_H03706 [Eucalyptus grandis]